MENKVLFSLLLSLEIEENKRGREMKGYYALKLCNFLFPITYMYLFTFLYPYTI